MTAEQHKPTAKHDDAHLPATVCSTFVKQYYHLLSKHPEQLHRFYKNDSQWCHGVGSHMEKPTVGQKAINDMILSRGYAGARVDLTPGSMDGQASLNGGVLAMVTGVMTLSNSPVPRPFSQTFFLAVQPNGYFVLNDVLRFLELPGTGAAHSNNDVVVVPTPQSTGKDLKKPTVQSAIGTPVASAASPATKSSPKAKTPVHEPKAKANKAAPASPAAKPAAPAPASPAKKAPVAEASPAKAASPKAATKPATPAKKTEAAPAPAAAAPASPAKPAEAKSTVKPAVKSATPAAAPATPAAPVPAEPEKPKTWAALFSAGTKVAAVNAISTPTPASPAAAPAAAPAKPAAASKPAADKPADASAEAKEKPRYHSLFVREVPSQAKESDVRELFKPYGTIANVTVVNGRGYAFVDYVEEESMRAALAEGNEFKLFDKVLTVDERAERKNDGSRGGFRTEGRGGGRGRSGPKARGAGGERKEREDNKERRTGDRENTAGGRGNAANGPRNSDRRDKGGRRGGKVDGRGSNNRTE